MKGAIYMSLSKGRVLKNQLEKVEVLSGYVYEDFYSDLLVYKESEEDKRDGEIVLMTLYHYKKDLKRFLQGNGSSNRKGKIIVRHDSWLSKKLNFEIKNLEDYEIHYQETSSLFARVTLTRKFNDVIKVEDDQLSEKEQKAKVDKHPLLIVTDDNIEHQKELLYNWVKNGVSIPMLPNVTKPQILAGQLFVDRSVATNILDFIQGTGVVSLTKAEVSLVKQTKLLLQYYKEWKDYLYTNMQELDLLQPAHVHYSNKELDVFEILIEEDKIKTIVQNGLKTGKLRFTENVTTNTSFPNFETYFKGFSIPMKERIYAQTKPLHMKGDISPITTHLATQLQRTPFAAQLEAIEASIKAIEKQNRVNLIGECGVGKTLMMLATQWMHAKKHKIPMKLLVLCPDTLVDSVWVEEIEGTLPSDVQTHVISSISDLIFFTKEGYMDDTTDRVFILNHHVAKTNYNLKPAVIWSKLWHKKQVKKGFLCPCCGETVTKKVRVEDPGADEAKYVDVPVSFEHFNKLRYRENYKCKSCDAILWEPIKKEPVSKTKKKTTTRKRKTIARTQTFVYVNEDEVKGFYPKNLRAIQEKIKQVTFEHGSATDPGERKKLAKKIASYKNLEKTVKGKKKEARLIAQNKVSVAQYIFKKMRYKFTHLIIDEAHEFQGDSARSEACGKLINSVKHIQAGTGTGMNGYAKSRFKMDYLLFPWKMKAAGYNINDKDKYQSTFGVVETRYRVVKDPKGKEKHLKMTPNPKPGISPLIFPLFMQDTTVFVALEDLYDELPDLKYTQIKVPLGDELKKANTQLQKEIKSKVKRADKKTFQEALRVGSAFLDMPSLKKEIKEFETGKVLIETPIVDSHDDSKLQALIKVMEHEVFAEERRCLVYTHYTNDGINHYLHHHLSKGMKVTLLNRQDVESISCDGTRRFVKKIDREKFIREEVAKGTQILVVNPELIKTGYNLTAFSTICYYQMGYQVYTNRQADKRTHRIGQERNCKIIYLYYEGTMQEDICALMATKIVASQAIEGKMDEAGLQSISNERTPEEELAKKFYEGIKSEVALPSYEKAI